MYIFTGGSSPACYHRAADSTASTSPRTVVAARKRRMWFEMVFVRHGATHVVRWEDGRLYGHPVTVALLRREIVRREGRLVRMPGLAGTVQNHIASPSSVGKIIRDCADRVVEVRTPRVARPPWRRWPLTSLDEWFGRRRY
jgi:hypothetical protein